MQVQILSTGSGPIGSFNVAGVGSFRLATSGTGDPDRALSANPAGVNSSTMKGPQGLASEDCGRRCQTANDFHRRVRGCFYVRSPEITINIDTSR